MHIRYIGVSAVLPYVPIEKPYAMQQGALKLIKLMEKIGLWQTAQILWNFVIRVKTTKTTRLLL